MSDDLRDLVKRFERDVDRKPGKIGLYLIPEYPELDGDRGMWSSALGVLLTTLRYLAPATLLTLFWGQQSLLHRILRNIDSAFRAIVFSNDDQKAEILQWLEKAGGIRVERLETVWRHGWVLCGVLKAALPGSCAGHPPARLSLKHAAEIASSCLGVEQVFTDEELATDILNKDLEWKLVTYLARIRQALEKVTPPVSEPASQRTSPEIMQVAFDYVARGSGLAVAQVNNKMYFKIYPTSQQSLNPGEITILIRGPKDTYGMSTIPPILGKAQLIKQKLLGLQTKSSTYTENALPLTQGAGYLRTYGKNDMNKTYHIPKIKYDIDIDVEHQIDQAKVGYVVTLEGKYTISITTRGQNIVGSPFSMTAAKNIVRMLEKESFCLEDGEEIDIVDVKSDRKVVLRVVDFITEKMLLKEDGSLEKITDEEAKILMSTDEPIENTDIDSQTCNRQSKRSNDFQIKSYKFNKTASKVVQMNRVCKILKNILAERRTKKKAIIRPKSQQSIPDIVNSTLSEINVNPFLSENRDKYIVPENLSVSLTSEKAFPVINPEKKTLITAKGKTALNSTVDNSTPDSLDTYESINEESENDPMRKESSNPFLNDTYEQSYGLEKNLGVFVKTDYERSKSQNEETDAPPIKIVVENAATPTLTPSPTNTNPFVEPDVISLERPKTPILKIITGEIKNRGDSVYVDPKNELISEEMLANEFINPFFLHHHQEPNFIIGAPVSLPPLVRGSTPEPNMQCIMITDSTHTSESDLKEGHSINEEVSSSTFSTPLHTLAVKLKQNQGDENNTPSSPFYSFESNLSYTNDNQEVCKEVQINGDISPKRELWDSAYVSIDDNNSSPDTNNNDNNLPKLSPSELDFIGPAEREIWESCGELIDTKIQEDSKPKWDIKRPIFTPIIEESDRSISASLKDTKFDNRPMAVTVAFAELHRNLLPSEGSSTPAKNTNQNQHTLRNKEESVNSASALSDVKRYAENQEGKTSEVQANATESVSVSRTLPKSQTKEQKDVSQQEINTKFNIVLEKKQYWDQRIREIEAKTSEEDKTQRKRRLSAKHLRHNDSLTKRRGKQLVKSLLNKASDPTAIKDKQNDIEVVNRMSPISNDSPDQIQTDSKLVEKWKNYWDNKLQTEKEESDVFCYKSKSPKSKESSLSPQKSRYSTSSDETTYNEPLHDDKHKTQSGKQELPEEVFKAFETSPKRFFGTSRKQILNKIDIFLGKPNTADDSPPDRSSVEECDVGLVSSRISLFHTISNTEELTSQRKRQSMQNIIQRRDSEKNIATERQNIKASPINNSETPLHVEPRPGLERKFTTIVSQGSKELDVEQTNVIREKRSRIVQSVFNKTFDEASYQRPQEQSTIQEILPKNTNKGYNKYNFKNKSNFIDSNILRKSSVSKSEMDIFSKVTNKPVEDDLDKYKSCEELPKINVKSFISLYEKVSDSTEKKTERKLSRTKSLGTQRYLSNSSSTGAVNKIKASSFVTKLDKTTSETDESTTDLTNTPCLTRLTRWGRDLESMSSGSYEPRSLDSVDMDIITTKDLDKQTTYVSLSDIEIEIVEKADEPKVEVGKIEQKVTQTSSVQEKDESSPEVLSVDYKSRFKMAKQFFQSLEELREEKKPKKLNECQMLLLSSKSSESNESLEKEETKQRPQKRVKKNIKSHSMPSSEISKIWIQLHESQIDDTNKLVKISEKFNVEDLFNDVMEGKLSRQGSLRGIPHKKAVLEAFRSMENLTDKKFSSYELAVTQLADFAKENKVKNAQTYLSEYPYLPTTDPSKYQSRLDAKATGLISLKELHNQKPRRNSVPDLRLNPNFTVQL